MLEIVLKCKRSNLHTSNCHFKNHVMHALYTDNKGYSEMGESLCVTRPFILNMRGHR